MSIANCSGDSGLPVGETYHIRRVMNVSKVAKFVADIYRIVKGGQQKCEPSFQDFPFSRTVIFSSLNPAHGRTAIRMCNSTVPSVSTRLFCLLVL
jgi:hypothetical protein